MASRSRSRSCRKRYFTPYRPSPLRQTPNDLSTTFTGECSLDPEPKRLIEDARPTKTSNDLSQLSNDALFSICRQACLTDSSSDEYDEMASVFDRCSINTSDNAQYPLIKNIPELQGLYPVAIVLICRSELKKRYRSTLAAQTDARVNGNLEESQRLGLVLSTILKNESALIRWRNNKQKR